jgi:osmotically-inducible protein OsmY
MLALSAPVGASTLDARIESAARDSYVFKTYLNSDQINIASKDGAVTLTGTVAENFHKSLAQETVSSLPGVKSVDNQLEVNGVPNANSDAWLSDKLKIALLFHRSIHVGKTQVEVKDGVVTLSGQAESQAQKDLATEYAQDIDGVKEVKNEIIVAPAPGKGPRTTGEKIDDASVTAQVKMALLLHRSTSGLKTMVKTMRGVVTLNGEAANAAEKELVTKLVSDINGVKAVKNRMSVK